MEPLLIPMQDGSEHVELKPESMPMQDGSEQEEDDDGGMQEGSEQDDEGMLDEPMLESMHDGSVQSDEPEYEEESPPYDDPP